MGEAVMAGQIIRRPEASHECAPGWTYGEWRTEGLITVRSAHPPMSYDYPKGTVWQCDCGQTWISLGEVPRNGWAGPGMLDWRPEHRRERRRRERAS